MLTKVLEWGRLMAYLEQSTRYVPYTDRPNGRWKYHVPAELDGSPLRATVRPHARHRLRHLRAMDSGARSALSREVSEVARRFRRRLPVGHPREGARHAARPAAGGDDVQRRAVRHGPGVRSAAAAHVRASAPRGPRARGPDARRTATGDPRVHGTRRSAESRRPLDRVSRGNAAGLRCRRSRDSRESAGGGERGGDAHRFRSGRRTESGRGGALFALGAARRAASCAGAPAFSRRPRGAPQGLRRPARQPPSQARTGIRTHQLPV